MPRRDLERGGHMRGAPIEHRPPPPPGGGAGSQGYHGPEAETLREQIESNLLQWFHSSPSERGLAYTAKGHTDLSKEDGCWHCYEATEQVMAVLTEQGLVQP